jgi:hypothetical protein
MRSVRPLRQQIEQAESSGSERKDAKRAPLLVVKKESSFVNSERSNKALDRSAVSRTQMAGTGRAGLQPAPGHLCR